MEDHDGGTAPRDDGAALPFLRGPLPSRFRRRHVRLDPGVPRLYVEGEWRDALVVVEQGRLDLECPRGGVRSFPTGAVLHLQGLALRALRGGPGPAPTVLTAVLRSDPGEPRTVDLPDRPYRGVRTGATAADRIPGIVGEVTAAGAVPAGPPFVRHHRIGPGGQVDAEAGVPVDDPALATGALPAGRYAVARHTGPADGLAAATEALLRWADEQGLVWDRTDSPEGELWGCRTEHVLTHGASDAGPVETELCFRLADD